jgi:hypothetical protein
VVVVEISIGGRWSIVRRCVRLPGTKRLVMAG